MLPAPQPLGLRWSDYRGLNESPQYLVYYYRDIFDKLSNDDFVWRLYLACVCQDEIPDYCMAGANTWQSNVPLICFHIVEWHQPEWVLRQFGMDQPIPVPPADLD